MTNLLKRLSKKMSFHPTHSDVWVERKWGNIFPVEKYCLKEGHQQEQCQQCPSTNLLLLHPEGTLYLAVLSSQGHEERLVWVPQSQRFRDVIIMSVNVDWCFKDALHIIIFLHCKSYNPHTPSLMHLVLLLVSISLVLLLLSISAFWHFPSL